MIDKVLIRIKTKDLIPYERNPRKIPKEAVDDVRESYRQCGVIDPIEIDENNVILSGHTRRLAAIEEGIAEVDALRVTGLTDEQKRKYRLLANKTGEKTGWDYELLDWELEDLDFGGYDFGFESIVDIDVEEDTSLDDTKYTDVINIPQYTPSGECPSFDDMLDQTKYNELMEEIDKADIPEETAEFLRFAAARHLGFNYKMIANFYAHQNATVQKLMEDSALVIIDVDDAIKNGYAELKQLIDSMVEEAEDEE